jgi:hypothetical protein
MDANEQRYRMIAALLQADGPLTASQAGKAAGMGRKSTEAALTGLVQEGLVVCGDLVPGRRGPQYRWAARWAEEAGNRAVESVRDLRTTVGEGAREFDLNDEPVLAFNEFVISKYRPPEDKQFLVFLQCSVRRPFWKSPSHGSMRRAISVATGYDPARDFEQCPVHVVVLASKIGPVPYDLADVYPANVGGGGVKHFDPDYFERVKPILAERMARYITVHGPRYRRMATFTDGRYGEVMAAAREIAGVDFPIFPDPGGPAIVRMGKSTPRTYWQRYWIQLYLEIVSWLSPADRRAAAARLDKLAIEYTARN